MSVPILVSLAVLFVAGAARPAGAQPRPSDLPVSLERIREGIGKPPALTVDASRYFPVARFKTSVDQRVYMLPFREHFEKTFELTPLQRQSHEWGSKCCGIDLSLLIDPVKRALRRRQEGRIRRQVARELAAVQAAAAQ